MLLLLFNLLGFVSESVYFCLCVGECKICSQYIVSGRCCKMQDVNFVIMKKQKKQKNVGIHLICCERYACTSERHRERLRQAVCVWESVKFIVSTLLVDVAVRYRMQTL